MEHASWRHNDAQIFALVSRFVAGDKSVERGAVLEKVLAAVSVDELAPADAAGVLEHGTSYINFLCVCLGFCSEAATSLAAARKLACSSEICLAAEHAELLQQCRQWADIAISCFRRLDKLCYLCSQRGRCDHCDLQVDLWHSFDSVAVDVAKVVNATLAGALHLSIAAAGAPDAVDYPLVVKAGTGLFLGLTRLRTLGLVSVENFPKTFWALVEETLRFASRVPLHTVLALGQCLEPVLRLDGVLFFPKYLSSFLKLLMRLMEDSSTRSLVGPSLLVCGEDFLYFSTPVLLPSILAWLKSLCKQVTSLIKDFAGDILEDCKDCKDCKECGDEASPECIRFVWMTIAMGCTRLFNRVLQSCFASTFTCTAGSDLQKSLTDLVTVLADFANEVLSVFFEHGVSASSCCRASGLEVDMLCMLVWMMDRVCIHHVPVDAATSAVVVDVVGRVLSSCSAMMGKEGGLRLFTCDAQWVRLLFFVNGCMFSNNRALCLAAARCFSEVVVQVAKNDAVPFRCLWIWANTLAFCTQWASQVLRSCASVEANANVDDVSGTAGAGAVAGDAGDLPTDEEVEIAKRVLDWAKSPACSDALVKCLYASNMGLNCLGVSSDATLAAVLLMYRGVKMPLPEEVRVSLRATLSKPGKGLEESVKKATNQLVDMSDRFCVRALKTKSWLWHCASDLLKARLDLGHASQFSSFGLTQIQIMVVVVS